MYKGNGVSYEYGITMKKALKNIRIIVVVATCIFLGYLGNKAYRLIFTPVTYSITSDNILSTTTQECIKTVVAHDIDYQRVPLATIAHQLKDTFPFVKGVTIAHLATGTVAIHLTIYKPLMRINSNLVLLESGILESQQSFKSDVIASLSAVSVHESVFTDSRLTPDFYTCLASISSHLFKGYEINWHNKHELWLTDKNQPSFKILCDAHSISNEQKLNLCKKLKEEIKGKKEVLLNKSKTWIADIRFDNQIIIFSRGGRGHGYDTST